jgi:hypothetical protein
MSGVEDPKDHFEGQDSPHSKNMSGAEDPKERFEGQDSPYSNNMSGAEDPKERFEGQDSPHSKNTKALPARRSDSRDSNAHTRIIPKRCWPEGAFRGTIIPALE